MRSRVRARCSARLQADAGVATRRGAQYAEAEAALITAERQCARMRAAQSMRKSGAFSVSGRRAPV